MNILDKYMDWVESDNIALEITKIAGTAVAMLGIIIAPFLIIANNNAKKLDKMIAELDKSRTRQYRSQSDCQKAGFSDETCTIAFEKALDIAGNLGTHLAYSSGVKCKNTHGDCDRRTRIHTTYHRIGDVTVPTNQTITEYFPKIVGVQFDTDDPKIAVPLYNAANSDGGLRQDGKIFEFSK